jgi:adenylate kinase family enzyme
MASSAASDAPMHRVLVAGGSGAGKSTFARRLGERLALPVIHLDAHYWRSGWQMPPLEEWREQVKALIAAPAWVMDGNYSDSYDIRMPRADSFIWLDYPRWTCMRRVLRRTFRDYGRTRPDVAEGCREKFDPGFLRFVWEFRSKYRPRIVEGLARHGSHLRVTHLHNDREVEEFLAMVGAC